MTREEAKEWLPIIQAWAEGKPIQYQTDSGSWSDIIKDIYTSNRTSNYRIKPEPKFRPFKNQEECWNEMLKHNPFGWVKASNGELFCIERVFGSGVTYKYVTWSFEEYLENNYNFADGTPFGIKED